ncbi:NADH-quinone oxidoreductase subunit L [Candidatus Igneacidithiobacillus taiwanensis]|uniref:NADH-quinone oxidoreductase subunit L n=1 Tax=Candidatus Igneacidithiobacillus taiwanensis TaxID=1945924 RepID=UPI00289C8946|nr:NADH-quinone oxidoreductase subunit L [Candidatus Igneacidithiobacillus taiwanensis]
MAEWLFLVPGFPLLGALLNALFGEQLGPRWCGRLAATMPLFASLLVLAFWLRGTQPAIVEHLWTWMAVGDLHIDISLRLDDVSLVMVSIASFVGFLIHLFSQQYLRGDYGERRYYFYLNLFVAGMLVLVLANNLLLLYLGWETVGLCSYALISHWYREPGNAWAGRKAFVVTRIGDTALLLGIFLLFARYHTLSIPQLLPLLQASPAPVLLPAASLLILIGAYAKSAQFPFHVWLPDSMAGPSTVSALIHAATMVTAGVYLCIRLQGLFAAVPGMLELIALLGAWTAFYAASCALAQVDVKRVLAYSTISQLGYMFLAVGIGAPSLGLFHLLVHGCFKALLFLGSGSILLIYADDHDIRHMGGLKSRQPFLRWTFLAGIFCLAAVPLVSAAFYSKDAIIDASFLVAGGGLPYALALAGALLTAAYAFRLYFMIFEGKPVELERPYQMGWGMKLPLAILAAASIGIGWLQFPPGWPGPHLWVPWLAPELGLPPRPLGLEGLLLTLAGASVTFLGIGIGYWAAKRERAGRGFSRWRFLATGWGIDAAFLRLFPAPFYALGRFLRRGVEEIGIQGLAQGGLRDVLGLSANGLARGENGLVSSYALGMVLGLFLLLLLIWTWPA